MGAQGPSRNLRSDGASREEARNRLKCCGNVLYRKVCCPNRNAFWPLLLLTIFHIRSGAVTRSFRITSYGQLVLSSSKYPL